MAQDRVQAWALALGGMIQTLVDRPDAVKCDVLPPGRRNPTHWTVLVHVDPAEIGRVVGRGHAVVHSLRVLTAAWSGKHAIGVHIEIDGLIERPLPFTHGARAIVEGGRI